MEQARLALIVKADAESFKQTTTVLGSSSGARVAMRGIDVTATATDRGWEFRLVGTDAGNEASEAVACTVTAKYLPPSGAGGYERKVTATVTPGDNLLFTASFRSN